MSIFKYCCCAGTIMITFVVFLNNRKSIKEMEIEELKLRMQPRNPDSNKS